MPFGNAVNKNTAHKETDHKTVGTKKNDKITDSNENLDKDKVRISNLPTILVAEDNDINLLVLSNFLNHFQCEIIMAKDGQQAIDTFKSTHIDLILMDISMPVMDGLDATRTIRVLERTNQLDPTPIIAITAHIDPANQHVCIDAGMNDYMPKPINMNALRTAFTMWAPGLMNASAA